MNHFQIQISITFFCLKMFKLNKEVTQKQKTTNKLFDCFKIGGVYNVFLGNFKGCVNFQLNTPPCLFQKKLGTQQGFSTPLNFARKVYPPPLILQGGLIHQPSECFCSKQVLCIIFSSFQYTGSVIQLLNSNLKLTKIKMG